MNSVYLLGSIYYGIVICPHTAGANVVIHYSPILPSICLVLAAVWPWYLAVFHCYSEGRFISPAQIGFMDYFKVSPRNIEPRVFVRSPNLNHHNFGFLKVGQWICEITTRKSSPNNFIVISAQLMLFLASLTVLFWNRCVFTNQSLCF